MTRANVRRVTILLILTRVTMIGPVEVLRCRAFIACQPMLHVGFANDIVTLVRTSVEPIITTQRRVDARRQIIMDALIHRILIVLRGVTYARVRDRLIIRRDDNIACHGIMAIMFIIKGGALKICDDDQYVHLIFLYAN